MRTLACLLLLCSGPALADPAWAPFFEASDAQVDRTQDGTRETVELPGNVVLFRQKQGEDWQYSGVDRSENGAVGCVSRILNEVKRVSTQCNGVLNPDQVERLDTHLGRIAGFYEQNAVPPLSATDYKAQLDVYVAKEPALQCAEVTSDFKRFAAQITDAASTAIIDDLLSVPRLPVTNPCL